MRQNTYGSAFGLGSKIDTPSLWAGLGTGQNLGRATDTGWVTGFCYGQGRNEGGARGAQFHGRRITIGAAKGCGSPKSPNNVTNTFFNTVVAYICFRKT